MGEKKKNAGGGQHALLDKVTALYFQKASDYGSRLRQIQGLVGEADVVQHGLVHLLLAKTAYNHALYGIFDLPYSKGDGAAEFNKGCVVEVRLGEGVVCEITSSDRYCWFTRYLSSEIGLINSFH
jgi:hypothetical protein